MRVLAYIHTFNDADVISGTIAAISGQTRPIDEILLVDNASTDGTLEQPALERVTIVRHPENLGASGAVCSGFRYAMEHDFDWIWTFDADSAPEPNALEKLLDVYGGLSPAAQAKIGFLACLHRNVQDGRPLHSRVFSRAGLREAKPEAGQRYYRCHVTTWSGCLFRVAAIRKVELPNPDYFADWGEAEYGYRMMKAGFDGFTCQDAVHRHNVRGYTSLDSMEIRRGRRRVTVLAFPPLRCYYRARNGLYLALYDFAELRPGMVLRMTANLTKLMLGLLLRPGRHGAQLRACMRGMWHGLTGNITGRY
jgi:rhamnosyltransferase